MFECPICKMPLTTAATCPNCSWSLWGFDWEDYLRKQLNNQLLVEAFGLNCESKVFTVESE